MTFRVKERVLHFIYQHLTDVPHFIITICDAYEGAMIDLPTATTLKLLGLWQGSAGGDLIERRMSVGMADLRFKARAGYRGWSMGKITEQNWTNNLLPMGADFIFGLWETYFLPPPPALQP